MMLSCSQHIGETAHPCMSVCTVNPRGRVHPGWLEGDWLSSWVLLTRLQFLHCVNTNRPVSHRIDGQCTQTHTYTRSTTNPCRAISLPVLHITRYSNPSSNTAVRETHTFSCSTYVFVTTFNTPSASSSARSVQRLIQALRGSVWIYVSRCSCSQSISGDLSTLPVEAAQHHPAPHSASTDLTPIAVAPAIHTGTP